MATARIKKEIAQCSAKDSPVKVEIIGDNLMTLKGRFKGPEDTPYHGGMFEVDIQSNAVVSVFIFAFLHDALLTYLSSTD